MYRISLFCISLFSNADVREFKYRASNHNGQGNGEGKKATKK